MLDDAQGDVALDGEKAVNIIYIVRGEQAVVVRVFDLIQSGARQKDKQNKIEHAHGCEEAAAGVNGTVVFHGVQSSCGTKRNSMSPGVS